MDDVITQRLVELTFAPLDEVAAWFTRLGMKVQRVEEGVLTVRNPQLNITTAVLNISDPITRAVCLGFGVAGVHWPQAFPDLLKAVDQAWRLGQGDRNTVLTGSPRGPDNKGHPARKPPPVTAPTFADLYKNRNPGE